MVNTIIKLVFSCRWILIHQFIRYITNQTIYFIGELLEAFISHQGGEIA